jgi:hypothetical protein
MTALSLAWLWLSLGPVVTVESAAACPSAEDVASRVAALLPARATDEAPDVARLTDRGDAWLVTLARPDGTPIGERTLERDFPCADLAAAAAVIIVAWESDVHSEFPPASPPPPPPPAAPPPVIAPTIARRAPAAAPARASVEVGAALRGSLAPAEGLAAPAFGGLVVASWHRAARRLGGHVAIGTDAERELPLGAGRVSWRRISVAAGPELRLIPGTTRWAFDLHADALGAWVSATGAGFANDQTADDLDAGLGGGARVQWRGDGVIPWLELAGVGWFRAPTAYATPGTASVALPRGEISLAVGLSFRAL